MTCVICGGSSCRGLREYPSPFVDATYMLYICEDCHGLFFDIRQHDVDLIGVYEQYAFQELKSREKGFRRILPWRHEVSMISRFHGKPVRSVLDVGCGLGDFLLHWPQQVRRTGIELASASAKLAGVRGLEVIEGFVEDVDTRRKWDVVTCYAVIEHITDPMRVLRTLPLLTEDSGIVVIMIPTFQCLKQKFLYILRRQWHMFCPPLHVSFMTRGFLDNTMRSLGFTLKARRYTAGGLFNPFAGIPILHPAFGYFMQACDAYLPLNRYPLFDHMYSYYRRASDSSSDRLRS